MLRNIVVTGGSGRFAQELKKLDVNIILFSEKKTARHFVN